MKNDEMNSRELLKLFSDSKFMGMGIFEIEPTYKVIFANQGMYSLFGYQEGEIDLTTLISKERLFIMKLSLLNNLKTNQEWNYIFELTTKDGTLKNFMVMAKNTIKTEKNIQVFVVVTDMTKEKCQEEELKYIAQYDVASDIYNSKKYLEVTDNMISENKGISYLFARFEINQFRLFCELLGNDAGNDLIKNIGDYLRVHITEGTYGRLDDGSFSFCVPLETIDIESFAKEFENHINSLSPNFKISFYFGLYEINNREIPVSVISDRATLTIDYLKNNTIKKIGYYDDKIFKQILDRNEIINDMASGIKNKDFKLYLQPVYDLTTGKVKSAEALVRWKHPKRGLISPGVFIPIFEDNGFIVELDFYIWEEACKILRNWIDTKKTVVPISVNVSRVDLYTENFAQKIYELVRKYDLPINFFRLEITESTYTVNEEFLEKIVQELKSYGFIILMDDFGSGYSSLTMLNDVSVDILKIDMRFLKDFTESKKASSIIQSIVKMAKFLNISVIAEGVETEEQLKYLRNVGSELGQGYFFSQPIPVNDFELLVDEIKDVKNSDLIDINDFDKMWNSTYQFENIFLGEYGSVGILCIENDIIKVVKMNDCFYNLLGYPENDHKIHELKLKNETEYKNLLNTMKALNENLVIDTCDSILVDKDNYYLNCYLKIKYFIGVDKKKYYYFAAMLK